LSGFKTTKNTIEFVNSNSDVPYDSTYIAKKDLPAVDADQLFNFQAKFMAIRFGNYYAVSKSMGKKIGKCKASHILISLKEQKFQIKATELKKEAKGESFISSN
jgi:peptidyl-prolyl cis-trans isomerase D